MREIKFRAWDANNKIMRDNVIPFQWDFVINRGYWECLESSGTLASFRVEGQSFTNLMQFTGLHDKNGKEIYEGDLLKVHGRNGDNPTKVIFEDGSFKGRYTNSQFKYLLDSGELRLQPSEVIGNIYENPELLGGKP